MFKAVSSLCVLLLHMLTDSASVPIRGQQGTTEHRALADPVKKNKSKKGEIFLNPQICEINFST